MGIDNDDETRPTGPPIFQPGGPGNSVAMEGESPLNSHDMIHDDVTIMIDRTKGGSTPSPALGAASVDHGGTLRHDDAIAARTRQSLDGPAKPASYDDLSPTRRGWTPPARPGAPGVDALQVHKQRSALWPLACVVLISVAIFAFLLWQLTGG